MVVKKITHSDQLKIHLYRGCFVIDKYGISDSIVFNSTGITTVSKKNGTGNNHIIPPKANFMIRTDCDAWELEENKITHSDQIKNFSDRQIPLIYQDNNRSIPVVTLENYCKWYWIFIVFPNGYVTRAEYNTLSALEDKYGKPLMGDHIFHPKLLELLAEHLEGVVDEVTLETALGRWMLEYHEKELEDI